MLPGRRALVPSQRDVATYDLKPQMSGREVATAFEQAFAAERPPLHGDQLRQRRHGRPRGRDPSCRDGRGDGRRVPRPGRVGGPRGGRSLRDHGRPRQRRADARPDQEAQHLSLGQSGAPDRHGRGVGLRPEGTLADVAPTVLALLRMEPSPKMGGRSLLEP